MIPLPRFKPINWQVVATIACAAITLHIAVTLIAPELAGATAYDRLRSKLAANTMQIMPPLTAETQLLPFMAPDARIAMCRFDSTQGTVAVRATLPGPGWTLSLHSKEGDNFYTAVAQPGRVTDVSLLLIPTDERFTGLTPEAKGRSASQSTALTLVAPEGIAILRAPDSGFAYGTSQESQLARAFCGLAKT